MIEASAGDRYQARIDRFEVEHAKAQRRWSLLANLRLALFAVLAVALWQALTGGSTLAWLAALALVTVLGPTLVRHRRLRAERDHLARMVAVNEAGRDRALLRWDAYLPASPLPPVDTDHRFARDLNVVGAASLETRVGTPATVAGWRALRSWLTEPTAPDEIASRQVAVGELADRIDQRQRVESVRLGDDTAALADLLAWAEAPPEVPRMAWIVPLAWVGPIALVAAIVLQTTGVVALPLWPFALALNLVVSQVLGSALVADVHRVAAVRESLDGYRRVMAAVQGDRPAAPMLQRLHDRLDGAADGIAGLSRVTACILPRGSLPYFPLQLGLAWDIHVAAALDRWRARHGRDLRPWLDDIGTWEALAALSVLRWDHPDWTMPTLDSTSDGVSGTDLRHPLLAPDLAVGNDVTVGPPGGFLFVTGSNMSGKSTLLRAVGANAVLAQAGAPVAAGKMTLPPLQIVTTMRVEDSLAHGVSFFLAELQRLRQVIAAADARGDDRRVLYLLDEILQGTNTGERQIASRRVLRHLTRTGAIGAVSSHDLTLIGESDLQRAAVPVHFTETFSEGDGTPSMTFDYRLRDGLATSTNALRLMALLGFPDDEV